MSVVDLRMFVSHGPDGAVVVCLDGELDAQTAPTLDELIDAVLAAGGQTLVIDVRDVVSVDVDGLRAVAHAHARAVNVGGSVRLRSPSRRIVELMVTMGLDGILAIDRTS